MEEQSKSGCGVRRAGVCISAGIARLGRSPVAFALILAAAAILVSSPAGLAALAAGVPIDTDDIVHLMRVKTLLAGGNPDIARLDGWPNGYVMHWTRPYDLFAAVPVLALRLVASEDAAMLWGCGISAALSVLLLAAALAWAAGDAPAGRGEASPRPGREGAWTVGPLAALAPGLLIFGAIGRCDHHILLLVPVALALGLLRRANPSGPSPAGNLPGPWQGAGAGAWCALSLWISVEGTDLALMAWAFCVARAWEGRTRSGCVAGFGLGFAALLALALALDPPRPEISHPWTDRLSVVFLGLGLLVAAASLGVEWVVGRSRRAAVWAGFAAAGMIALAIGLWLAAFPDLLAGAEAVIGPFLAAQWWPRINELMPLTTPLELAAFGAVPVFAAASGLAAARTERRAGRPWVSLLILCGATLAALALAVSHRRFSTHAGFAAVVVFSFAPCRPWGRALAPDRPDGVDAARAAGVRSSLAALASWGVALGVAAIWTAATWAYGGGADTKATAISRATRPDPSCDVPAFAADLARLVPAESGVLTTRDGDAPRVEFLAGRGTLAGPYQRNRSGLEALYAFSLSDALDDNDAQARAVLAGHRLGFVLLCPGTIHPGLAESRPPRPAPRGPILLDRLARREFPSWLTPVPWSAGTTTSAVLLAVRPER